MSQPSVEVITGRLGVGAIALLSAFLFVDGLQLGLFPVTEEYGATVTWGLIGAIPTLVVAYILGIICVGAAELLFAKVRTLGHSDELSQLRDIATRDSEFLQQLYIDLLRRRELLEGSTVAFLLLALGSWNERSNMLGSEILVYIAVAGALFLAVMCIAFAVRIAEKLKGLAALAAESGSLRTAKIEDEAVANDGGG